MTIYEKSSQVILDCLMYNMTRHLRPLYITAQIDGKHVSWVLLDNGASINIITLSTLRKPSRDKIDLIPTDVVMANFTTKMTRPLDVLLADITVKGSTMMSTFLVMKMASN